MTTVAEQSFALFVYPFLFDTAEFEARARAFDDAHWGGKSVWLEARFPHEDMLAYLADYLNPVGAKATARLWKLNDELENVLGLAKRAEWQLLVGEGREGRQRDIPFQFGEVGKSEFAAQLMLFSVGVGLLAVQVKPKSERLDQWLDFVHFFRFAKGQRGSCCLRARRRVGVDEQTRQPVFEPFFPAPAGGVAAHADGRGVLDDILSALLLAGAPEGRQEEWWREVFVPERLIPFAVLYVDGLPDEERGQLIHRLRNFFHARQQTHPAAQDLRLDHPSLLPFADDAWFICALDGGSFLACDAPPTPFFRETLPAHLRDKYFFLFLLVLHQRFALISLSQQVTEKWLGVSHEREEERSKGFVEISNSFLEFTSRGYFVQVMQSEHHHRSYLKWQQTFQIRELYEEVREEVREMQRHYDYVQTVQTFQIRLMTEERQRQAEEERRLEEARERAAQERVRRLEERLSFIGVLIGVPALTISFLGINIKDFTTQDEKALWLPSALLITFGGVLVGALLLLLLRWSAQHRREEERLSRGERADET